MAASSSCHRAQLLSAYLRSNLAGKRGLAGFGGSVDECCPPRKQLSRWEFLQLMCKMFLRLFFRRSPIILNNIPPIKAHSNISGAVKSELTSGVGGSSFFLFCFSVPSAPDSRVATRRVQELG